MPILRLRNFRRGLVTDPAFDGKGGADDIQNLEIDRHGRLISRKGYKVLHTSAPGGGLVTNLYRGYYTQYTSTVKKDYTNVIVTIAATTALQRAHVTEYLEILNYSKSPTASFKPKRIEDLFCGGLVFQNRFFIGFSSDEENPAWVDLNSTSTLRGYTLGRDAPTDPTLSLVVGGDLSTLSWYGFAYTFYNSDYGIETKPTSTIAIQTTASDKRVRITLTRDVDRQWDKFRIYRTTAQTTQAAAQSASIFFVGEVTHTPGTGTVTVDVDATTIGGVSYTLGAENDTDDHDRLTRRWAFAKGYAGRIWAVILPRTIVFSKVTTTGMFPDWFPQENSIEIGSASDTITGLELIPGGGGLLVFTERRIFVLRGDSIANIDISSNLSAAGCAYPRTIVDMGDYIYYVGTDNQIWRTNGSTAEVISRPINNLISHLRQSWKYILCAVRYRNQYWLSFPSGTPVTESSANTTITSTSPIIFSSLGGAGTFKIKDNNGWDLSKVKPGMFCFTSSSSSTNPDNIGMVTSISDTTDEIVVEQISLNITSGIKYSIISNDTCLVFDSTFGYWTRFSNINASSFMWWYGFQGSDNVDGSEVYEFGGLWFGKSDGGLYKYNRGTSDNGSAISCKYKTNWNMWDDETKITGVRVIYEQGTATTTSVILYKNFSSTSDVSKSYLPVLNKDYRVGLWSRGRAHQLEISGNALGKIQEIVVEYEKG